MDDQPQELAQDAMDDQPVNSSFFKNINFIIPCLMIITAVVILAYQLLMSNKGRDEFEITHASLTSASSPVSVGNNETSKRLASFTIVNLRFLHSDYHLPTEYFKNPTLHLMKANITITDSSVIILVNESGLKPDCQHKLPGKQHIKTVWNQVNATLKFSEEETKGKNLIIALARMGVYYVFFNETNNYY